MTRYYIGDGYYISVRDGGIVEVGYIGAGVTVKCNGGYIEHIPKCGGGDWVI